MEKRKIDLNKYILGPSSPRVAGASIYKPLVSFIWCKAAQDYTINSVGAVSISSYKRNKKVAHYLPPLKPCQNIVLAVKQTSAECRAINHNVNGTRAELQWAVMCHGYEFVIAVRIPPWHFFSLCRLSIRQPAQGIDWDEAGTAEQSLTGV